MRSWIAVATIVLAGCTTGPLSFGRDSNGGRLEFERSCAVCHGATAHGDGPMAASLRKSPPDLTRLGERHGGRFPEKYVLDVITGRIELGSHGTREMPVWKDRYSPTGTGGSAVASIFSRRNATSITEYVGSLQRPAPR